MELFQDKMGRYRTQSLFLEFKHKIKDGFEPIFTLAKEDTDGALSMYRLYMEVGDPTEYETAIQILGSWEHWEMMAGESGPAWFKTHLNKWRAELKQRLKSEYYKKMKDISVSGKTATERMAAVKWLNAQHSQKTSLQRGRPTKEEVQGELQLKLRELEEINEDAKRLGV